jgi:hypothetical protein
MDGFKATMDYCKSTGIEKEFNEYIRSFKGQVYSFRDEEMQELDGSPIIKSSSLFINDLFCSSSCSYLDLEGFSLTPSILVFMGMVLFSLSLTFSFLAISTIAESTDCSVD